MGNKFKYDFQKINHNFETLFVNKTFNESHIYTLYTTWNLRSCTGGYISCMTKSPAHLPLTPPQVSDA